MTRQDLTDAVLGWLHRASVRPPSGGLDIIGSWITLGEGDINMDMRARCMVARATQAIDGQYAPLPCDYLEAMDVRVAAPPPDTVPGGQPSYVGRELLYQPRREMGDARTWSGNGVYAIDPPGSDYAAGGPRWYSIVADMMEVWPATTPPTTPPPANWAPYYIEMSYYVRQTLGPLATDTTAVLAKYPGAYLYATLRHAAPFMRDGERQQTFQANYEATIFRANSEHERARSQGSRLVARHRTGWGHGGGRYAAP